MTPLHLLPSTPFTRATALSRGFRPDQLARAVRDGDLVRVLRGVYVRSEVELTPHLRAQAAALVLSDHIVVCDRTASWIWGVEVNAYAELDGCPPLETCAIRGREPVERPGVVARTRDLSPDDWVDVAGVAVTTPLRTCLDLACLLPRRDALAAMDALMRTHGFSHAAMRLLARRYFRRRGVVQMRSLIPLVDPRSESRSESWVRLAIVDRGLPCPVPQYWVMVDATPTYRLDLAYPHARIAVEYDGEEFHTGPEARRRDRQRREWLRAQGWTVLVLTKSSLTAQGLDGWLEPLTLLLAEAAAVPVPQYTRSARRGT